VRGIASDLSNGTNATPGTNATAPPAMNARARIDVRVRMRVYAHTCVCVRIRVGVVTPLARPLPVYI